MRFWMHFYHFILNIFYVFVSVCSYNSNSNTIKDLCGERNFCDKKFGITPTEYSRNDFSTTPCFCDDSCSVYGDCCHDSPIASFNKHDISVWTCVTLPRTRFSFFLKAQCNSLWSNDSIRSLCEQPKEDNNFGHLYVTNILYNITYLNFFCAICNGEIVDYLKPWQFKLNEPLRLGRKVISNPSQVIEYLFNLALHAKNETYFNNEVNAYIKSEISVSNKPPIGIRKHLRRCRKHVFSCAFSWADDEIIEKCKSYIHYVYDDRNSTVYRNTYCALCNYVPMSHIKCFSEGIPESDERTVLLKACVPFPTPAGNVNRCNNQVLMNGPQQSDYIDTSSEDTHIPINDQTSNKQKTEPTPSSTQLSRRRGSYRTFTVRSECESGHILIAGKCVRKEDLIIEGPPDLYL